MKIGSTPRSAAQQRIIDAALELFAEYGVSGTSLQNIADALGVTKAAVYHQFHTKEEIVLAAVEVPLRDLASIVDLATQLESPSARVEVLVDGFVNLVVQYRHTIGPLQGDPTMARIIESNPPYAEMTDRLLALLTGDFDDDASLVRAVMTVNAIIATGASPAVADVDPDVLRRQLRDGARRLIGL